MSFEGISTDKETIECPIIKSITNKNVEFEFAKKADQVTTLFAIDENILKLLIGFHKANAFKWNW